MGSIWGVFGEMPIAGFCERLIQMAFCLRLLCALWSSSTDSSDFNHRFHGWTPIKKNRDPNRAFLWDGCVGFSRKEDQENAKRKMDWDSPFAPIFSPFCGWKSPAPAFICGLLPPTLQSLTTDFTDGQRSRKTRFQIASYLWSLCHLWFSSSVSSDFNYRSSPSSVLIRESVKSVVSSLDQKATLNHSRPTDWA